MGLITELRRRNVLRVLAAYLVLSWLLLQVGDVLFETLELPKAWNKGLLALLALGLVPTIIFAWVYELTPDGIRRDTGEPDAGGSSRTGGRLNIVIGVLAVAAIALFALDQAGVMDGPAPVPDSAMVVESTAPVALSDETPSIAVLPFTNMSTDPENRYFADGISEEILNLLADVEGLAVASRTSSFGFRGEDTPIPDIARALGVRYVLEGSVRKAGEQVRVTAQLIDAQSDRHLWSETWDRQLSDIFAIQDEIAGSIGDALQVELLGTGGEAVRAEQIDPASYARFLEARHELRKRSTEAVGRSLELLLAVVEDEPRFARGHAVLAEAYMLTGDAQSGIFPRGVAAAQARFHADLARELDPDLGGVYLILGSLAESPREKLALWQRAIDLEPDEPRPYHWRGVMFSQAGLLERALVDLRTATRLEPDNVGAIGALGMVFANLDRVDEAIDAYLDPAVDVVFGSAFAVQLLILHDRLEEAEAIIDERGRSGRDDLESMRPLIEARRDPGGSVDPATAPLMQAQMVLRSNLLALRRFDEYLETAVDAAEPGHFDTLRWMDALAPMRADPRFVELLTASRDRELWDHLGPPPDCRATDDDGYSCGHGFPDGYGQD